jgi:hypothetical protein
MAKGSVIRIEHEPMDDGSVLTRVHHKANGKSNKGAFLMDHSEEKVTHATPADAGAHTRKVLEEHFGPGGGDDNSRFSKQKGKPGGGSLRDDNLSEEDKGPTYI